MAIKINSENLNKKRKIDLSKVERVAKTVLKALKKKHAEINIVFLSSQKIRVINRLYLKRDRATDVIAFPGSGRHIPSFGEEHHSGNFMGDIAICSDKAHANAKVYGMTFAEEIALYTIHGILHLLGYEDVTKKGRDRLRRKEDELFRQIKTKKISR